MADATRIVITERAREVLDLVRTERGEGLALVIGNGCCDATAPYLFAGYVPGPLEHRVAEVGDVPVFLDDGLVASFAGSEVVVDARADPGADSFSCEAEMGYRLSLERLTPSAQ